MHSTEADGGAVRVLVALEPRMYREAIAHSLRRERPRAEVTVVPAGELSAEGARLEPHLVVANTVPRPRRRGEAVWVAVSLNGRMAAEISAAGYHRDVEELALEDLLEAMDHAAGESAVS